jgi:hypothetical protein
MILGRDTSPERQLYYIGALILETVKAHKSPDFFSIYSELKRRDNISFILFISALDWLFILGIIKLHDGGIKICS